MNRPGILWSIVVAALIVGTATVVRFRPNVDQPPTATAASTSAAETKTKVTNTIRLDGSSELRPHFELGEKCALCHSYSSRSSSQQDLAGRPVAAYDLWQSSMMAQSARDPYWRAVLSAEIARTPNQKAHLEDVCTRCHTPMAAPFPTSPDGEILALLKTDSQRSHLGLDGVSCTLCHQIADKNLGQPESFTGHFELNADSLIYGPHAQPTTMPMQRHVAYTPTHAPHILKSALCATCHTVITEAVTAEGALTDHTFHEQAPYLEWRNSEFNDELDQPRPTARSCQSCHLPTTDEDGNPIKTMLAHNPGGRDFPFLKPREPFGRHTLVGGNAFMTQLLRDNAQELGIKAPRTAFDASLAEIRRMLREQTATIEIGQIERDGSYWRVPITVTNLTGHKFPTAYPSRRAWIQLKVYDRNSRLVFVSGAFNQRGELIDANDQVLPAEKVGGPMHPHYQQIETTQQVQVYESLMGDLENLPTFYLLHGAKFLKDNRLLPRGWQADHADAAATWPQGLGDDPDFAGGSDTTTYRIPVGPDAPHRIEATLLFQTISVRYAAELFVHQTPEVQQFKKMYESANHEPELIANASALFPDQEAPK